MRPKVKGTTIAIKSLLVLALLSLVVAVVLAINHQRNAEVATVIEPSIFPVATNAESRLLLVGETFWGRYIRDASLANELKYQYPFSRLNELNKPDYDAWIAHLECPITNNSLTSSQQEATLTFNCRPEFLTEAAKWFDVFSLANNHTDNMGGQTGLDETRQHLEEHQIQHYGHYDNAVKDELCEIISIPINVNYSSSQSKQQILPIAMCGYHGVFAVPTEDELDVISLYSEHFLTIITPQMGAEYEPVADQIRTDTYRKMIDRGADMVVASHPHWVQNTEVYKDKLIMYSIGNFLFDQQDTEEVRRGAGLDLTIQIDEASEARGWFRLAEECEVFGDECLELAQQMKLEKPEFDLSYDVVVSFNTNYVTGKAPEDVEGRVLERLNWEETKSSLTLVN